MFRLNLEQYRLVYGLTKIILPILHIVEKLSFTHCYILYCIIHMLNTYIVMLTETNYRQDRQEDGVVGTGNV
jgi:hypothetical protein